MEKGEKAERKTRKKRRKKRGDENRPHVPRAETGVETSVASVAKAVSRPDMTTKRLEPIAMHGRREGCCFCCSCLLLSVDGRSVC